MNLGNSDVMLNQLKSVGDITNIFFYFCRKFFDMNHTTLFTLFLSLIIGISCKDRPSNKITNSDPKIDYTTNLEARAIQKTSLEFDKTVHNFGEVDPNGGEVQTVFHFTNVGESDLLINEAKGSCGCTVPKFPTRPIAPGEKDSILVSFDPQGFTGLQQKIVTLYTNTDSGEERVRIIAQIKE